MTAKSLKWIFAAIVVLGMGTCGAFVMADTISPPPVPVDEVRAALEREIRHPGAALPVVDSGVVPMVDGRARADATIPAGECLFAVVGGATPSVFSDVALFETESRQSLIHVRYNRTVGLGWCAAGEPLPVTLWGMAAEIPEDERTEGGDGSMIYRFHVGPPDGRWEPYIAGDPVEGQLEALTEARGLWEGQARDAETAPAGTALFRVDVEADAALALPLSDSTAWAAKALGTVGRPQASFRPRLRGVAEESRGVERPVAVIDDRFQRVLAVVDPSDLPVDGPVPCVRLHFSRLGGQAREAVRLPIPTMEESRGADHRLCPGDPLTAFVTEPRDGATWRLRVLRAEGPSAPRAATAVPSEPLVAPAHRRALASCDAGDAAACAEAARHLATGRYVARDDGAARELAARACRAQAEHCGIHGELLERQGNLSGAVTAWDRGCHAGDEGWSCVTLGEAYRLGRGHAFDARSAYEAYQKGCRLGVDASCRRASTMELLELGG